MSCGSTTPHDHLPNAGWSPGTGRYRPQVDLLGHAHLGGKTLLNLIDGLFGGYYWEGRPYRWDMVPFDGDWPSSLFVSQDPVALDSVGYDFLLEEWPHVVADPGLEGGAEDYLHEAALADRPPSGVLYDPDGTGKAISSLGVHEHWNNADDKQYSRNLGAVTGIELVHRAGDALAPAIGRWERRTTLDPSTEVYVSLEDGDTDARTCGTTRLRVTFDQAMDTSVTDPRTVFIYGVRNGDQSAEVSSLRWDDAGRTLTLELYTDLPDQDTYVVSLEATLRSGAGRPLGGAREVTFNALVGDVNGDGRVDRADSRQVARWLGKPVTMSTFQYDVTCDGRIDARDVRLVMRHWRSAVP